MNALIRPLSALVLSAGCLVTAAQEKPKHHEEDTPLMQQMEQIEHAHHFLRRSLKDPAQDDKSLEQCVIAEQACLTAKQLTPKMAARVEAADKAQFVKDFRTGIAALLVQFVNVETALLAGDRPGADAAWKQLEKMEDEGHNNFTDGE